MIWWLTHSKRLNSEKAKLTEIDETSGWLTINHWYANKEFSMCVDFEVNHYGEVYQFEMIYPSVFPDAPPMIFTRDKKRISGHQYGAEGELCLEYRPDNWNPLLTGADMVTSCYKLIRVEHPSEDTVVHAQSAHIVSLGRDLRSASLRFLLTSTDIETLDSMVENNPESMQILQRSDSLPFVASLSYIGSEDTPIWVSDLVVSEGMYNKDGIVVRVPEVGQENLKLSELCAILDSVGLTEIRIDLFDTDENAWLLIGDNSDWRLFWICGDNDDRKIFQYKTVLIPEKVQRLPQKFRVLIDKKVGIVGCGSIGSKIAASLSRSGVGNLILIDADIFFPGNVSRNELTLDDIGVHKALALKDRLLRINPKCDVKTLRILLGSQESSSTMTVALEELRDCDLVIDASADPTAFNMVASVSCRSKLPMVWCQLFAGGVGGFVARARPNLDPTPQAIRDQIQVWCEDQNVEWLGEEGSIDYEYRDGERKPLIADDSEVAVIAAHATRFATDILTEPDTSIFPASAYLIGLSEQWIFNEPFDTAPIELIPAGDWGEVMDPLTHEEMVALLKEHFKFEERQDEVVDAE